MGETPRLDGCFASLWAVEVILNVVRKKAQLRDHVAWVPHYLFAVLKRACVEMGVELKQSANGILQTRARTHNVFEDFKKLLDPPAPFPAIHPHDWHKAPVFGVAAVPWYGLAVVLQGQTNAPEKNHKHFETAINWLTDEHIRCDFHEGDDFKEIGKKIIEAMLWPPLCHPGNQFAELNFPQLQKLYTAESKPDQFINALLRILISQNRLLSVLAGATCFLINIAPTSPLEARCVRRAQNYFKTLPPAIDGDSHERVMEVVKMLAAPLESPLNGLDHPTYPECIMLANRNKYEEAAEKLSNLIVRNSDCALYLRMRGKMMEKIGKDQYALDDYNEAIRLKDDYWQALTNRGSLYLKRGKFQKAYSDFFSAFQVRPECETTRDLLLEAYFLTKKDV